MNHEARELALKLAADLHKQEIVVQGVPLEPASVTNMASTFYTFLIGQGEG